MKKRWIIPIVAFTFLLAACGEAVGTGTSGTGGTGGENPGETTGGTENPGGSTGGTENPGGTTGGTETPGGNTPAELPVHFEGEQSEVILVLGREGYTDETPALKAYRGEEEVVINYTVTDNTVAAIRDGKIEAVGKGSTYVTAQAGDETQRIWVNVLEEAENFSITNTACVKRFGRTREPADGALRLTNTASGFEANFIGTELKVNLATFNEAVNGTLKVLVDGEASSEITFPADSGVFTLADGLEEGLHSVQLRKMTEQGYLQLDASNLTTDGTFLTAKGEKELKFEFYGDSISSGYGNLGSNSKYKVHEDGTRTYASMLAERFDAEYSVISYAGVPACLSSPNALFDMGDIYDKVDASCNVDYDFASFDADVVFVNLGTNDSNDPAKTSDRMRDGYAELIRNIRTKRPDATIMCVYGMMGVDKVISNGILAAIDLLTGRDGMENIYYLELSADTSGGDGHPVVEIGHKAAADLIESYLNGRVFA